MHTLKGNIDPLVQKDDVGNQEPQGLMGIPDNKEEESLKEILVCWA